MWVWEREFFTIASELCDNMGTSWFTSGTWRKSWLTTNFGTNPKRRTSDSLIHPLQAESVMKKTRWWSSAYISVAKNISFLRKNGVFYHETMAIFGSKSWIWGCFFSAVLKLDQPMDHHLHASRYGSTLWGFEAGLVVDSCQCVSNSCGGFHKWSYPFIAGLFISGKIQSINAWLRETPMT